MQNWENCVYSVFLTVTNTGVPHIYLKVTTEKNWSSPNFDFLSLKDLAPGLFLGAEIIEFIEQISLNFKNFLLQLKNHRSGSKSVYGFYTTLILKGTILLKKNKNFNKNKMESKLENPTHSFREMNHVLQLI